MAKSVITKCLICNFARNSKLKIYSGKSAFSTIAIQWKNVQKKGLQFKKAECQWMACALFSSRQFPRTAEIGKDAESQPSKQVEQQMKRNADAGMMTELVRDFIDPAQFYAAVRNVGIDFFCGVPDSLLKDVCGYIADNVPSTQHIITCNEGNAVAMAAGYHLATGKCAMVYLQNSGLGNIVNPLMSLATPSVYSMPMLLLIGWRGEPGKRDEPQHISQGEATPGILAALHVPFQVLPDYQEGAEQALEQARHHMNTGHRPYALLVRRQTFLPYKMSASQRRWQMSREESISIILDCLHEKDAIVATTGMLSRELFEIRVKRQEGHERDFLTVGSMGHASAIAMGIAMHRSSRQVFCLDGDGAALMHLGALATIGQHNPDNFKHIVINNGAHDSVGGQMTAAADDMKFSLPKIASACGYRQVAVVDTPDALADAVEALRDMQGPALLEVKVEKGGRKDLGRPTRSPIHNKRDFMHFLAIG